MTAPKKTRRQYPVLCCPSRPHMALGLCQACWQYWRKHGDVTPRGKRLSEIVAGHDERKAQVAASWNEQKKLARRTEAYRLKRNRSLRQRYGITLEDYERMLDKQGGCCKICANPPATNRVLVVDHHHKSGRVRALLCDDCNNIVGVVETKPARIEAARQYVEEYHKESNDYN